MNAAESVDVLLQALPYIQRYDRETVVIKYGGHAMGEESVARLFVAWASHRSSSTASG